MTLLGAWMHDLDSCAVHAFGRCLVQWYGLSYVLGFAAAWLIVRTLIKRERTRLSGTEKAGDLVFGAAIGAVIGGRLGYVLLYQPSLLTRFEGSPPWWGVLALHEGGMASHGGMIGVILACVIFARREKVPWLHATDLLALATPAGLFFGRLANFVNGELLGKIVAAPGASAPWWAVRYPQELLTDHAPELTPEQVGELQQLAFDVAPEAATWQAQLSAVIDAARRGVGDAAPRLEALLSARHPSQLYQAAAEGIVLGVALWFIAKKTTRIGVVSAWFLLIYGVLRVATEQWRLPDDHLATPEPFGMSRGRWLSVAMLVAGGALLWRVTRTKDKAAA